MKCSIILNHNTETAVEVTPSQMFWPLLTIVVSELDNWTNNFCFINGDLMHNNIASEGPASLAQGIQHWQCRHGWNVHILMVT